jgi:TonB family protein
MRDARPQSANDRFKKSVNQLFLGGIVLATVLHFGLFQFFPQLTAADLGPNIPPDSLIVLPPPIEIPAPPEPIERPQVPVVDPMILDDVTIPPTKLRPEPLPRPPDDVRRIDRRPVWVPHTVRPEIKNRERAAETVLRHYPKILQDAGVGGTVFVWVFIDRNGIVRNAEVQTSSGVAALDEAALRAAYEIEFTPALNMDATVAVWASFDITFQVPR